jgi:hypothetical protein
MAMAEFAAVNGPWWMWTITVDGREYTATLKDGRKLRYVEVSEAVYLDNGTPLMMVEGTSWQFSDDQAFILFAHPDWPPTLVNLRTSTFHPCDVKA